ncbi:hypothetical protein GCM10008170_03540 [Methylopila capsulata]|uniref:Uncharacterized protein n=2 Tax=Methylopila capsulata TaxID=61654 RepID=A0A9W6IS58_9HYPH|nr:hypothetical protein GCM10008170_03540 [Methylopila capsulata]
MRELRLAFWMGVASARHVRGGRAGGFALLERHFDDVVSLQLRSVVKTLKGLTLDEVICGR